MTKREKKASKYIYYILSHQELNKTKTFKTAQLKPNNSLFQSNN